MDCSLDRLGEIIDSDGSLGDWDVAVEVAKAVVVFREREARRCGKEDLLVTDGREPDNRLSDIVSNE